MASTTGQISRRPVISVAVDCTCNHVPYAPLNIPGEAEVPTATPDCFRIVRKSLSQLSVVSQDNVDTICVNMDKRHNPFGLEWHVSSVHAAPASAVVVKKAFMSGLLTFEKADGTPLASLTHSLCSTSSKLQWKNSTYRWKTTSVAVPLTLELVNTATGNQIACLKGAAATPWSKERYRLSIVAGQYGPTWLQVVAASAIAEAQRVNGKFSSCGAASSSMAI